MSGWGAVTACAALCVLLSRLPDGACLCRQDNLLLLMANIGVYLLRGRYCWTGPAVLPARHANEVAAAALQGVLSGPGITASHLQQGAAQVKGAFCAG